MKLSQFLSVLVGGNVQITLLDMETGKEIITLKAAGYEHLDDTIEAREVKQWEIVSTTSLKITLGEVLP